MRSIILGWVLLVFVVPLAAQPGMHVIGHDDVTHTAVADGDWFNPATWNNGVPGAGAVAHVPAGRSVTYAGESGAALRGVLVDGQLVFATQQSSTLRVDTFEVGMAGHLRIGTQTAPVQPDAQVRIIFPSDTDIDINWDPTLLSRGLVAHGKVDIHGARKTVHGKVAVDPLAGHTSLVMAQPPQGWRVGDTLVLTGTRYAGWKWDNSIGAVRYHDTQDEVVTVTSVNGATVGFTPALQFDHRTPRPDLKASVANFSRNVRFETENGETAPVHRRGHVMLMHHTGFDVRYAEFHRLGRTDKSVPSFDPDQLPALTPTSNVRTRYAMHLHFTGLNEPDKPAMVVGNAVFNSPGWGYVHHASNAVFHDNASFDTHGAGFVAETGDEIGSWVNNIAIKAKGNSAFNPKNGNDVASFDMGRTGAGFWFQGRMVRNVGNVAASVNHGYVYLHRGTRSRHFPNHLFAMPDALRRAGLVSPDHPPILNFHDNEAFASTVGLYVVKADPNQNHDIHTHISSFRAWEVRGGAAMEYTSHYLLEDLDIIGKTPEPFSSGAFGVEFGTNASDMVINRARIANMPIGVVLSKDFTDVLPPSLKQYVAIDVAFDNVPLQYEHLDTAVDRILQSGDLVPQRFEISLNNGEPLEYNNGSTAWEVRLPFTGSKVDSIGEQPIPAGTDWLGVPNQEMIFNVSNDGYYRDANGVPYAIVPQYFTSRADGRIHKYGLVIRLGPDVEALLGNPYHAWRDAFQRGVIDLGSQPPVAGDDVATVSRDGEVVINVLANDSDPDGDALDVDGLVPANHGLVFRNDNGTLTYRPDLDFTGTDTFGYWATDRQGHFSPATVTVTVSAGLIFANGFESPQ
jgi:hypothetical protein